MSNKFFIFILIFTVIVFISSCEEWQEPGDSVSEMMIVPVKEKTYGTVNLYWSEYDGENFDRYEVYYKMKSEKAFQFYSAIKSVKQVFTTIYNLLPKTVYEFYVKAVDKRGKEYNSKIFEIETFSDEPDPPILYEISEKDIKYYSIRINWSKFKNFDRIDFKKYEIYVSPFSPGFIPSNDNFYDSVTIVSDTSREVRLLKENTTYYFKIRTFGETGKYAESNTIQGKTLLKPPDTVFLYKPVEVTESYAIIKWTKTRAVRDPIYSIYIGLVPAFEGSKRTYYYTGYGDTIFKLTDLKKYEEYFVWVTVSENTGLSSVSNGIDFTATMGGNPVPVTLSVSSVDRKAINLSWTNAISRYYPTLNQPYAIFKDTVKNFVPSGINGIGQTRDNYFIVSNLKPNTVYYFKVMFTNDFDKFSYSNEVSAKTLP